MKWCLCSRLVFVLTALSASSVVAGEPVRAAKAVEEPSRRDTQLIARFTTSYVFESDFERGDDASGDVWSKDFELGYRIPIEIGWPRNGDGSWYLRLGGRYVHHDFNNDGGLPLPDSLQSVAGVIGLEYLIEGRRAILFDVQPGVYFEHDINDGAFDAPVRLAVPIPINDSFAFIVGAAYSRLRSYPLLPLVGFNWKINDRWTVAAIPPDPRIIYSASKNLHVWFGGELTGGSYRTDRREVNRRELSGAVVTYSDWRVGAGVTWESEHVTLEVGGGYAFQREFDFHRAEQSYKTDEGAPFARIEIQAAF